MTAVDIQTLTAFGARLLVALGVPEEDARLVSDSLVTADAWGHPSHGMLRLPWYVARLRSGAMRAVTQTTLVSDAGAVAVLDGHDGVGQVVTQRACDAAVRRAAELGVAVVGVRHSNHFGTAAYWTRQMAARGYIGILTTNGSPAMAPWGGRGRKTVGANPWSVATPGPGERPLVLDIANTGVARGKIYAAAERGEAIPEHWAIDADGRPTTDPHAAIDGLLAPMAGHKGYGISFMMDVLSGVLTGSSYATDVVGPYVPDQRSGCGHLVVAIRVSALMAEHEFAARVSDLVDTTTSVPRAAGVSRIYVPGEIEAEAEAAARARGAVELPAKTLADLRGLAADLDVIWPPEITVPVGSEVHS